jgi:iron-regulated transporter 1
MVFNWPSDEEPSVDDRTPLLDNSAEPQPQDQVPVQIARRLYVSHFLSTWNSRVFEFGAVLYLATIFPRTLLPMSVYALIRGLSAIVFAPAVGRYVDTGNRLQVVRVSIGESSALHNSVFICSR